MKIDSKEQKNIKLKRPNWQKYMKKNKMCNFQLIKTMLMTGFHLKKDLLFLQWH